MHTEKLGSVSLLTGTFPGLLIYRGGQVLLYLVYSPYWDKPRLPYFIGGTCELPPCWIIPRFYCEYIGEHVNKSCCPYWDIPS